MHHPSTSCSSFLPTILYQMKSLLFTTAFSVLLLRLHTSAKPCSFPAIFNFGDSNSDTGGLSAAFEPSPPPNGETFFHMPAGRVSDGRLIIDFIAKSFGLPYLSAYLDSLGANFSHGANFATSSSTIVAPNMSLTAGGYSPFSLGVQFSQFSQFKPRSQMLYKRGGVFRRLMPKEEYFSRALYTFDIGQNDLTALFFSNQSADEYIPNALSQFAAVVKGVYGKGGRSFWVHNTGPLGCLPYVRLQVPPTAPEMDATGCAVIFNELAKKYNRMLNETVAQLRKELPLAAFTYVDVYSAKYSLYSQPEKYGFKHPLRTCCGYGGGKDNFDFNVRCGNTAVIDGVEVLLGKSCRHPEKSIIWDGVHYTENAARKVFEKIATGKFSDPSVPLSRACHGEAF